MGLDIKLPILSIWVFNAKNMKQKLQNIARVAILFIIFCLVFSSVSEVLYPKWEGINDNPSRVATFYIQPKDSIDVLFLGASSFLNGISPLAFWEKFGFTSYSRASTTQHPAVTYYYLVETLKYQNPKVVVLDGVSLFSDQNVDKNKPEGKLRQAIDPMKLSAEKLQLIFNIVSKSKTQEITDYLFPLFRYHYRWKELNQADFEYYKRDRYDPFKGENVSYIITPFTIPKNFMKPTYEIAKYDDGALKYFEKAIQFCKKNGIQVVFVTLPRLNWTYSKQLAIKQLSEKYDLPYIDYSLPNDSGGYEFDASLDFYDNAHLNIYGAQKISEILGAFLQEKYVFSDKRNDPKFEQWNIDLQYFKNQLARENSKDLGKKKN
jgi:hypothetical protein